MDLYHVNMRMKDRFIPRQFIIDSTSNYEIIEAYPTDKYFPSYLVRSEYQNQAMIIVWAIAIYRRASLPKLIAMQRRVLTETMIMTIQ